MAVYDDASGNTHYLEALASETFELLAAAPADGAGLARRIAGDPDLAQDESFQTALAECLSRLEFIGLVERMAG